MEKEQLFEFFRKKRFFPIGNDINYRMADQLQETILLMLSDNPKLPIHILLNSIGGQVGAALTIYDFLMSIPSPSIGYVNGKCHSAALVVLAGCKNRLSTPNSRFLCHSITSSIEIKNVLQTEEDIKSYFNETKRMSEAVALIQKNSFGIQKEDFLKLSEKGERTRIPLFADEAKQYGIIHKIVKKIPIDFSL